MYRWLEESLIVLQDLCRVVLWCLVRRCLIVVEGGQLHPLLGGSADATSGVRLAGPREHAVFVADRFTDFHPGHAGESFDETFSEVVAEKRVKERV